MMANSTHFDVIIVDNGLVGMAVAKALAGSRHRIALIASQSPPPLPSGACVSRLYALTPV